MLDFNAVSPAVTLRTVYFMSETVSQYALIAQNKINNNDYSNYMKIDYITFFRYRILHIVQY